MSNTKVTNRSYFIVILIQWCLSYFLFFGIHFYCYWSLTVLSTTFADRNRQKQRRKDNTAWKFLSLQSVGDGYESGPCIWQSRLAIKASYLADPTFLQFDMSLLCGHIWKYRCMSTLLENFDRLFQQGKKITKGNQS